MNSLLLAVIVFVGYLIAYHTYGKFLAKKIFKLDPGATCPSEALQDDHDFVPTKKEVLFGHHFTSIAGLGPIVGPAIAVIWGWVPAMLWIFFGSIFVGAVHDFGSMVISLRADGRSIGDIAADLVNKRVRTLFLLIIFFELWIVVAVFSLIIALLFTMYPIAVFPVWSEIIIAMIVGHLIYKKSKNIWWTSIGAVVVMYITVIIGAYFPVDLGKVFAMSSNGVVITWVALVLIFSAWLASSLPVHMLLQPRDFINSHQLMIAMFLLAFGVIVSHPPIVAPAVHLSAQGAPPMWPFIFVILACGAVSGFHSLVGSGTSSKQCDNEPNSLYISFGSMLWEGALATLVVVAVAGGIGMGLKAKTGEIFTGAAAFAHHYSSWNAANGLAAQLDAFVQGSANMLESYGIPEMVAMAVMAVFIVSFASTTVDTATRIQRYVIVELAAAYNITFLTRRQVATAFAVITAALLAYYDGTGRGAMKLWPLFGSVNQLLAGLALLITTIYLAKKKINVIYSAIPMVFMVVMTGWAMAINIRDYYLSANWPLFSIGLAVFALEIWMIIESIMVMREVYGAASVSAGSLVAQEVVVNEEE